MDVGPCLSPQGYPNPNIHRLSHQPDWSVGLGGLTLLKPMRLHLDLCREGFLSQQPNPLQCRVQQSLQLLQLAKLRNSKYGAVVVRSDSQVLTCLQKYTVQPTGIYERISSWLAIDPKRSTGIPLNPQFRNPPPGANDPKLYDDPVTIPAGDIADNPYFKRDVRRAYPRLSVVTQPDVVGLLTVGSAAQPKEEVLQVGDAGNKQLVALKDEGQKGLATFFQKDKTAFKGVLAPDGMPPLPTSRYVKGSKNYKMVADEEQTYGPA